MRTLSILAATFALVTGLLVVPSTTATAATFTLSGRVTDQTGTVSLDSVSGC
ncbi:MAG: hypothetical protein IT305_11120 [Chloroflexi bacterium]|nr:hypothetical protein [Chloroflexota bacterium]